MILASHVIRGMALPPSDFFTEVLEYYGLQPHNIGPNNILVVAAFEALFEGYLGVRPSLDFFRYFFHVRRQTRPDDGGLTTCGSVSFNCRWSRSWYPQVPCPDSIRGWTSTFFYCKDVLAPGKTVGIPPFVNAPPMPRLSWREEAVGKLTDDLRLVFRRIEFLTSAVPRLDGVDIVLCWLTRQIRPLRYCSRRMCEYTSDVMDPLRVCKNDISDEDVQMHL